MLMPRFGRHKQQHRIANLELASAKAYPGVDYLV